ncbi:MAG TPA: arylesterase [Bryobacteraceae bacterium]|nr:arylesterase [Bryobacteraceae bacterium]
MRKALLFAALVALCACRQQPQSSNEPTQQSTTAGPAAPQTAAPQPTGPVIACFGDSLTAGLGVDPGQTYPDDLQRALDGRSLHYRVVNLGVSGDTTQDGLARLPLLLARKPALVVLELGANDGLRGLPVAITESNLARIIEALQQAGTRVVLAGMTLPPNYGPDYIRSFSTIYPRLAKKYKVTLIPFLLEGVAGDTRWMQRDGLHPNAEGCERVAQNVLKAIEPLLRS